MPILLELQYWPPVSWLALATSNGALFLESCENYQKGSYRNRCHIAGPNGLQRLSIPLQKGKHQQTSIREVRIAYDEPWQQIHWRGICAAYGNAPFFEHFAHQIEFFYQKRFEFLFDFNLELLYFFLKKTGCEKQIQLSATFQPAPDPKQILDLRDVVSPKRPTPPDLFLPETYPQVFLERHGFLPDLSALDLLFCCGKQSAQILQNSHA